MMELWPVTKNENLLFECNLLLFEEFFHLWHSIFPVVLSISTGYSTQCGNMLWKRSRSNSEIVLESVIIWWEQLSCSLFLHSCHISPKRLRDVFLLCFRILQRKHDDVVLLHRQEDSRQDITKMEEKLEDITGPLLIMSSASDTLEPLIETPPESDQESESSDPNTPLLVENGDNSTESQNGPFASQKFGSGNFGSTRGNSKKKYRPMKRGVNTLQLMMVRVNVS